MSRFRRSIVGVSHLSEQRASRFVVTRASLQYSRTMNQRTGFLPSQCVCLHRWNYVIVKYSLAQVRTCCRVYSIEDVSLEDLQNIGPDIFSNSPNMRQKRLNMMSGVRDADCDPCWNLEDAGVMSRRTSNDKFLSYMSRYQGAPSSLDELVARKEEFTRCDFPFLEIQIDNHCDLKCLYCWPEYSLRWQNHFTKMGVQSVREPSVELTKEFQKTFWEWYSQHADRINSINIIGGEPLVSSEFYQVVDRILREIPNDGVRRWMSISTNLNATPERYSRFLNTLRRLLEKFNVSIEASCEATGARGEFIRNGLVWERFAKNFESLCQFSKSIISGGRVHVGLHLTHNLLSLSDIKNFMIWAHRVEREIRAPIHLQENMVVVPKEFSPLMLTPDFADFSFSAAEYIRKNHTDQVEYTYGANWTKYAEFLESIGTGILAGHQDSEALKKLSGWILSEKKKGGDLERVFPEYREFFRSVLESNAEGAAASASFAGVGVGEDKTFSV